MSQDKKVFIYTDGACTGNPGPGGWGAVLTCGDRTREISGGQMATTNNRMELVAAIQALSALKRSCEVEFITDSEYLRQGITKWIAGWKRNRWLTKEREPVKNQDLWRELDALTQKHQIRWNWVKGHNGHAQNERCDLLARKEVDAILKSHTPEKLKASLMEFKKSAPSTDQLPLLSQA